MNKYFVKWYDGQWKWSSPVENVRIKCVNGEFYVNGWGYFHNLKGPAFVDKHDKKAHYFIHGREYEFDDYLKELIKRGKTQKEIFLLRLKYA